MKRLGKFSGRIYNSEVTHLNISIETFPSNLIASLFHFEKANLFEADINATQTIQMDFGKENKE